MAKSRFYSITVQQDTDSFHTVSLRLESTCYADSRLPRHRPMFSQVQLFPDLVQSRACICPSVFCPLTRPTHTQSPSNTSKISMTPSYGYGTYTGLPALRRPLRPELMKWDSVDEQGGTRTKGRREIQSSEQNGAL